MDDGGNFFPLFERLPWPGQVEAHPGNEEPAAGESGISFIKNEIGHNLEESNLQPGQKR